MPYYSTNQGQFGGSPYNNPQMAFSGYYNNNAGMPYLQWYAQMGQQAPNPMQAISSMQPYINEQMQNNFAQAAAKYGRLGALHGSGYQNALGEAARKASQDIASIANQYAFNAAQGMYGSGLTAAQSMGSLGYNLQALAQNDTNNWWNRYYDWYRSGGSPENMQWWQNWGGDLFNQYKGTI